MSGLFSEIKGQNSAVRILSSQLEAGKITHGYLLLGERGSGKEFLAKSLAKKILCLNLKEKEACESCRKFELGGHPDFTYIDGREGIKIDAVRSAIEMINLSPGLSKYKVLLVAKAEGLGIEAANALLKTLEEPPADSIIILTAVSEKSLPQTIISRTQRVKLLPLKEEDVKKDLSETGFDNLVIEKVMPFAESNIGEAKKLAGDKEYLEYKKRLYEDIKIILVSQSIIEKFKIIESYDKSKDLAMFFYSFSHYVFTELSKAVRNESAHSERLRLIAEKVLKIQGELEYNVNLRLAMEELILADQATMGDGAKL